MIYLLSWGFKLRRCFKIAISTDDLGYDLFNWTTNDTTYTAPKDYMKWLTDIPTFNFDHLRVCDRKDCPDYDICSCTETKPNLLYCEDKETKNYTYDQMINCKKFRRREENGK